MTTEYIINLLPGWTEGDIENLFTDGMKKHFAVNNIANIDKAVLDWKAGKITIPFGTYEEFNNRRESLHK